MKDWVGLFADYITPNGTNVSDACLQAGERYIKQLNQVSFPTKQRLSFNENPLNKKCWAQNSEILVKTSKLLFVNFQANGAALKMFDASAKVSFLPTNTNIFKTNHCYIHLDRCSILWLTGATTWATEQPDPSPPGHLRLLPWGVFAKSLTLSSTWESCGLESCEIFSSGGFTNSERKTLSAHIFCKGRWSNGRF